MARRRPTSSAAPANDDALVVVEVPPGTVITVSEPGLRSVTYTEADGTIEVSPRDLDAVKGALPVAAPTDAGTPSGEDD
jgi:hypothetical protein